MPRIITSVQEWIRECKTLTWPSTNLDNIMLFTGAEGAGKSTLAYQICKALDPNFSLSQLGFSISEYMKIAKNSPKQTAVMCDEFLVNRRKAMRTEIVDLLDFFQQCRGLNLHHAVLFPHIELIDRAILNHRVRWVVHIPRRGLFQIKEKVRYFAPGGVEEYAWRVIGQWYFAPNKGPEWEQYLAAKEEHMRQSSLPEEDRKDEWDMDFLRSLPRRYEEARQRGRHNSV